MPESRSQVAGVPAFLRIVKRHSNRQAFKAYGSCVVARRFAGAFRNTGQEKTADEIVKTMQKAGYKVRETDPFENPTPVALYSTIINSRKKKQII